MTVAYEGHGVTVHIADALDVLAGIADASVDAVVTDPPYGLEFMGKEWDKFAAPSKGRADLVEHSNFTAKKSKFKDGVGTQVGMPKKNPRCRACSRLKFDKPASKCACGAPDWDTRTREYAQDFQQWCEAWAAECLRVLKPGGHLLAFGGTRTWHRLACAIEDSGFEVRDSIAWLYGSGFSKSWNFNTMHKGEWCSCTTENALPYNHADNTDLPRVRDDIHPPTVARSEGEDVLLLPEVQRGGEGSGLGEARTQGPRSVVAGSGSLGSSEDDGRAESGMGGRFVPGAGQGLPDDSEAGSSEGSGEWLRGRAPARDGSADRAASDATRGGASHQRRPGGQPTGEPEALPGSHESLDDGALRDGAVCSRCGGLDQVYKGFGTGIKPAFEPVVVARKPLIGTVAANVLAHGTGALNIDGCRVGDGGGTTKGNPPKGESNGIYGNGINGACDIVDIGKGRWPANVVLDESQAEALDEQSGESAPKPARTGRKGGCSDNGTMTGYGTGDDVGTWPADAGGGASRFFYVTKAPTSERPRYKREGGSDNATTYGQMKKRECNVCGNRTCPAGGEQSGKPWPTCGHDDWSWVEQQSARDEFVAHPTVKPLSLMRWLVRLVTPPGGTVLDPFAGSGTTAEACILEGFRCVTIDKEPEHLPLILQRINRQRDPVEAIRQRGEDLGLFDHLEGAP